MKSLLLLLLIATGENLIKTDDNSPELLYYGDWSATTDPSFFEKGQHVTDGPYANCYFTFSKSTVRWIGSKGSDHGYADVYIDGDFQQTIDTYSEKELPKQLLFEKKGLAADNTLRWGERSDMRDIVNTITNKIASRQRAVGYSNYYPESESYTCLYSPYLIDGKRNLHMQ